MAVLNTTVIVAPGIPTPELLGATATALVGPLLVCNPRVTSGPNLTVDTGVGPLVQRLAEFPNFTAKGTKKCEASFGWNPWVIGGAGNGHVRTFVDDSALQASQLVEALIETMQLLQSPIGWVDEFEGGLQNRRARHGALYQKDKTGPDLVFGYVRGFSGIAWRTVLGPDAIDFFGGAALAGLPEELATKLDDATWLLTPCESPADWTANEWCPGERQIIESLGVDCFFDPSTETLPTQLPTLAEVARIPVKATRRPPEGDVLEYFNGYPEPV